MSNIHKMIALIANSDAGFAAHQVRPIAIALANVGALLTPNDWHDVATFVEENADAVASISGEHLTHWDVGPNLAQVHYMPEVPADVTLVAPTCDDVVCDDCDEGIDDEDIINFEFLSTKLKNQRLAVQIGDTVYVGTPLKVATALNFEPNMEIKDRFRTSRQAWHYLIRTFDVCSVASMVKWRESGDVLGSDDSWDLLNTVTLVDWDGETRVERLDVACQLIGFDRKMKHYEGGVWNVEYALRLIGLFNDPRNGFASSSDYSDIYMTGFKGSSNPFSRVSLNKNEFIVTHLPTRSQIAGSVGKSVGRSPVLSFVKDLYPDSVYYDFLVVANWDVAEDWLKTDLRQLMHSELIITPGVA